MAGGRTSASLFPAAVLALAAFAFCLYLNQGEATDSTGTCARVPGGVPSPHGEERGGNGKRVIEKSSHFRAEVNSVSEVTSSEKAGFFRGDI